MKVYEWSQNYSVGVVILDEHHKELFKILNQLFNLMDESADDDPILKVIDNLLNYTHYHFAEEEKIMAKIDYPELEEHKILHKEIIDQLNDFAKEAKDGMAIFVAIKIATVGIEWLKNHILSVDHKYYNYMKKLGIDN